MQKDAEVADLKSVMTNTFMALMAADHKPDKKIVIYATSHATNEKIADSKAKWLLAIAYEAAIKAGYDPKNIEIKCNNKKIELDALPLTATERGILNNIAAEKQKFREAVVGPEHKTSSAPKTKAELEADSKKSKPELEADAKKAKDKFEAEAKETQGKLKDLTDQKPVTPAATPSTPTAK